MRAEGTRRRGQGWSRTEQQSVCSGWGFRWRQEKAEDSHPGPPALSLLPRFKGAVHLAYIMRMFNRWLGKDQAGQCSEIRDGQPSRQRQPDKLPTEPVHSRSKRNTESRYNHIVLLLITKDVK